MPCCSIPKIHIHPHSRSTVTRTDNRAQRRLFLGNIHPKHYMQQEGNLKRPLVQRFNLTAHGSGDSTRDHDGSFGNAVTVVSFVT